MGRKDRDRHLQGFNKMQENVIKKQRGDYDNQRSSVDYYTKYMNQMNQAFDNYNITQSGAKQMSASVLGSGGNPYGVRFHPGERVEISVDKGVPYAIIDRDGPNTYRVENLRTGTRYSGILDHYLSPIGFAASQGGGTVTVPFFSDDPPKRKPRVKKKIVSFDSVIAPQEDKDAIMAAIEQVANHELIFDTWGFGDVFEKGTAISMLFYGIPGTGKTLMAQAIADKLDKKVKVVSTAEIEGSEPGGAERAIKQFFESTKDDTILLFDECDSLVYDRNAVGSILAAQVNQLLTCLEKYTGIVIFTTNQLGNLDEAFNRRLSLKLEFKMPDKNQRIAIWKRMFPKKAPLDKDIDWDLLADFEVTGGYIKNAVLRAARMAAAEKPEGRKKKTIKFRHLAQALKAEILAKEQFEAAKVNKPRLVGGGGYSKTSTISKVMEKGVG